MEISELMSKVLLAYGGRDALLALEKNSTVLGEQKAVGSDSATPYKFRSLHKGTNVRIDVDASGDNTGLSTVYDGVAAWKAIGKIVQELPENEASVLSRDAEHRPSILAHYGEPGYIFRLVGRTTYHAEPVFAVEAGKQGEEPETLYVDEKNYLLLALSYKGVDSTTGKSATVSFDYSQYRPAGGTLVPFKEVETINDKPALEMTIASVDVATPIDDAQFRRPDRPSEVRLSKSLTVPIEYSHKEILVKVSVNGSEPLDFLLDTAASQTVIDRGIAAATFLAKQGQFNVTAAGGIVPTQMTTVPKMSIGDAELNDVQALILDLAPQTRQMGKRIDGILGANVLSKFAVTIDYSKQTLTLNDANTYKPPAGANLVGFTQKQGPLIKGMLNGNAESTFLVDTGAAFNNLPTKTATKYLNGSTPHMTEGTGLDGRPVKLAELTLGSLKVGTQTLKGVRFTYSVDQDTLNQQKGFVQGSNIGVLGNPFWQNFAVTLDYKFQRLVLQPNTVMTSRQEVDQLIATGDSKLVIYRDLRGAEENYEKALMRVQSLGDAKLQARIWGRIGNLRRVMAKDLNRPEQARIAYEYFSKAQDLAHKLQDRDAEGRILADWSLLYLDNGQIQAAQQALQGATLYSPQDAQVNVDFAVYLYKMQMYPDMQKYIEKALFLDPTNWQALWYKIKLAEMFNDSNQMKDTLKEIVHYYPWSKLAKDKLAQLMAPPVVPGTTPGAAPSGTPTAVQQIQPSTPPQR